MNTANVLNPVKAAFESPLLILQIFTEKTNVENECINQACWESNSQSALGKY